MIIPIYSDVIDTYINSFYIRDVQIGNVIKNTPENVKFS